MEWRRLVSVPGRAILDFALPPRCSGCGTIIEELHGFCVDCWSAIDWLGDDGCRICGIPLEPTDEKTCGRCLAKPPAIRRTRAAVEYGDIARMLVLKLKYSRKVALARSMARYMTPLLSKAGEGEPLLVPVPLHRGRLWTRGFNQSVLIAERLSKATGIGTAATLLRRTKRTKPLKGMRARERKREVGNAFKLAEGADVSGRRIILIDDVLTTGSTAEACARTLLKAGADSVELICFARVLRPARLDI